MFICTKHPIQLEASQTEHRWVQPRHTFAMCLGEVLLRGWARGPCALAAVVQGALIPGAR